jgi:hypothetical protein
MATEARPDTDRRARARNGLWRRGSNEKSATEKTKTDATKLTGLRRTQKSKTGTWTEEAAPRETKSSAWQKNRQRKNVLSTVDKSSRGEQRHRQENPEQSGK